MFVKIVIFSVMAFVSVAEVDITKGPPDYDKPWVAAWGFNKSDPTLWKKHHLSMIKQTEENKDGIKVVFFGDSKTYGWIDHGLEVWNKYYVKRRAFNYGIRGDSTRQILWRIQNKELNGLTPKLLVFMIGGNNFKNNYNRGTDEEIVKAMVIIIEKLREKLPKTEILFVGQLPRGSQTERAKNINKLLENHFPSKDKMVHFLNNYEKFTHSNGEQNKSLFISDYIHLNRDGYQVLAESIEPLVKKLLNEK